MVQKLPMKDLKITLKQKDVVDDDVVNIQFVGNEIHINRSDKDVKIIKDKKKIDIESLTKTPYINVDIILDSTEQKEKEKTIIDQLIWNFHSNTDKFYIEHDKKTNTFTVKKIKKRAKKTWRNLVRLNTK